MTASTFQPIAARPAPIKTEGLLAWIKSNLFGNLYTSLGTIAIGLLLLAILPRLVGWAFVNAVWAKDYDACHSAAGACWGVVAEKYRIIIFGRYPFEEQWRALVAVLALLGLLVVSCMRAFWKPWLAALWLAVLALFFTLMYGGVLGLSRVETDRWGGLPLTLLLASLSMSMAFPHCAGGGPGTALQLARHSQPVYRLCGADSWGAADFGAVHGLFHVSAADAAGLQH